MARGEARERISRRLGSELGLKGLRAARGKSGLARRPYPPGQHGRRYRRTRSEYLRQLEEKQKARFFYGIRESQLRRYFELKAAHVGGSLQLDELVSLALNPLPLARQLLAEKL